jgi:uroporphyrin-III C-methyltransferase/precorrin-2 dehydrogenase/sirohydrochlorin ferrochelatase/uroporphyrin-III C-methyltransferase
MCEQGKVYLVGAGPGDPELLTLKALRLVEQADVVVYDRLVAEGVLDLIPEGVSRINVGKASGHHSLAQKEINELLVRLARGRRCVVRLKGGDPFVFGRGSEEALHLRRHGIPFEVVPGITAATACSAYAGVPLTHRGTSRGVRLVTGHFQEDQVLELDWRSLADPQATLVIYMGLSNLKLIARQLVQAGLAPDTPALAVQDGTLPQQRRVFGPLCELPQRVARAGMAAPLLAIIGRTVALADELDWYLSDENAGEYGHVATRRGLSA